MPKYKHYLETGEMVHVRQWLAELFGVQETTVSRWVRLGNLESYAAKHVLAFIEQNPRMLVLNSRNRRSRVDAGVPRPDRRKKVGAARSSAQKDRRLSKPVNPIIAELAKRKKAARPAVKKKTRARK